MFFASDNTGPVHPKVLEAIAAANKGYTLPYGNDPITQTARDNVREVFDAPEAEVFFVTTGAAANSLILASWANPWSAIFCGRYAHIHDGEGNSPEAFSDGAKLTLVGAAEDKFTAAELDTSMSAWDPGHLNNAEPGPVSITQVAEWGTIYTLDEIRAIADVTHGHGQKLHMDGARFANAVVALGVSAAEMSWRAGVDAVTFGGTKNGLMGVETAVFFDPEKSWEFQRRRKRAAHLLSKSRYLAAQVSTYLENDLWLELATKANSSAARLCQGIAAFSDATIAFPCQANLVFAWMPRRVHRGMIDAGVQYYIERGQLQGEDPEELLLARFVCGCTTSIEDVDQFLDVLNN
ncbi:MAG: low specificity L-threonine aldolase [Boseongicola sp.]|nr:MAG: low specificity L-threonine aldolase [Boseongicola sp.]